MARSAKRVGRPLRLTQRHLLRRLRKYHCLAELWFPTFNTSQVNRAQPRSVTRIAYARGLLVAIWKGQAVPEAVGREAAVSHIARARPSSRREAGSLTGRTPRCRLLDRLGNRCTNEELADGTGLCAHHLAQAVEDYRQLVAEHGAAR